MADIIVEIIIAFLCVIGVVCLIKSVYDRIYTEEAEKNFKVELVFRGDAKTENLEYVLKKAKYIQKTYYPFMNIRVEDIGCDEDKDMHPADRLFQDLRIQYEDKRHGREEMDMHQRDNGGSSLSE